MLKFIYQLDVFCLQKITKHWEDILKNMIYQHYIKSNSIHAKNILDNWEREKNYFSQIVPKKIISKLKEPINLDKKKLA